VSSGTPIRVTESISQNVLKWRRPLFGISYFDCFVCGAVLNSGHFGKAKRWDRLSTLRATLQLIWATYTSSTDSACRLTNNLAFC
jgi:hypothetical protein